MVRSSSASLWRPAATLSSSPFFLALTAMGRQGAGNETPLSLMSDLGAHIVSPVLKPESFVTIPISPARIAGASSCLPPLGNTILPILSDSPVRSL